jgi:O-acetylserine/cysteine efflux transporter
MPLPHIALAICVAVLWGVNFVVMKHAVSEVPPLTLTGLRFLLAALPLMFFVARPAVAWRILLGFGAAFGIIKFGLLFTAFKVGMPAGLGALVLQIQAVFTIVLAYVWLADRPQPLQWLGIGCALLGIGIIVSSVAGGAARLPVALTLAAALAWAVANLLAKSAGRIDMLGFAVWTSLFPGVAMLLAGLLFEGPTMIEQALLNLTWSGIAAIAYLAYPISIISGAMWGFLLSRHSLSVVAPFALLVPVIGMLSGYLVYGETLTPVATAGAALIVVGLLLNVTGSRQVIADGR